MNANKVVTSAVVGTALVVFASDVQRGNGVPSPQVWIGLAALFIMLGVVADYMPQVAVPLALLIFFAVLGSRGEQLLNGLIRATRKRRLRVVQGGGGKNVG